jgi:hypothetical protein
MKLHELFESEERSVLSVKGKQPDHVTDHFSCANNKLTSLEGAPSSVGGTFFCANNKLTSLEGAPSSVGGNFNCYNNKLTSLEGAPSSVGGNFNCYNNKLTSLEGAPSSVGGNFNCYNNNLTSLHNIHKQIKHIKHIGRWVAFEDNPIKSHVLGLLLIDGLYGVILDNREVSDIINKHLKGERDVFACQEELIEAGFEEFAQL